MRKIQLKKTAKQQGDPWSNMGPDWPRVLRGSLIAIVGTILACTFGFTNRAASLGIMIVGGAYDVIFGLAGEMGVW